jgi:hypothetical protein
MVFASSPLPSQAPDSAWPIRRAAILWLGVCAAFWIPLLIGAYWLLSID